MTFLIILVTLDLALHLFEWSQKREKPKPPVAESRKFEDFRSVVEERLNDLEAAVRRLEDASDSSLSEPFAGQFSR